MHLRANSSCFRETESAVTPGGRYRPVSYRQETIHYFRLTADNRILFGGDDAKLFWGGVLRDGDRPSRVENST